jgi:predicted metalloendopeptidase
MIRSSRFLLPFVAASLLSAAEPANRITAVDKAYMNLKASPCQDFYTYANGAFDGTAIPGEYAAYGVNQEIDERNFNILRTILETSAKTGGAKGTVAQRVGDFYASGMDEPLIEQEKIAPLQPLLREIAGIKTAAELIPVMSHLQQQEIGAGFGFGVQVDDKDSSAMIAAFAQGGLGLPERDYYFRPGPEAEDIRTAYVTHVSRMLELAGDGPGTARTSAAAIMALETKLAKVSRTLVERRDPEKNYNKFERSALAKLAPSFAWDDFFSAVKFPAAEKTVLVGQPEFFTALGGLLSSEPISTWQAYLRWQVLRSTADYLTRDFVDERFAFYSKKLSGTTEQKPRWKRVLAAADRAIGEDLGQLYVQKAFSPQAKARALDMVKFHKEAMRAHLKAAAWMSESTKAAAYQKLDTMNTKVGYPDKWRDYSRLEISRRAYVLNFLAANAFDFQRDLDKLGKPVDRNEWFMTPQTNNAYYEPSLNEMCFPAGILQPPFFDEKADDASNYGALASTIGHELTHGFDDQGRQYDWQGNLKSWWTDDDVKRFEERAELVAKQYDAFEVLPGLHINGHQTLGENIADVGGLRISFDAFKLATKGKKLESVDGFTPEQRFFIAFAQGWRTNERPENVRLHVTSDVHSPVRWRVIGPVANFPEFRNAFNCTEAEPTWSPIW